MSAEERPAARGLAKRLFDYFDMKINPVLLRDLRLYGRGKGMLWTYFFILAVLVLAGIAYVLAARWNGMDGRWLLHVPTVLLSLAAGAAIPNLVAERFRGELAGRAVELILASPLTPARLVRGKLFGAWCLTLQAMSLAAPVFATAYLLGGVTAWDILALAGGVLLAGAVMPLPQMCLATNARVRRSGGRVLFGLALVVNAILMYAYATFLYETFVGDPYTADIYLAVFAALAVAGLLYAQFLYFVTVGRLRGGADNRESAPRASLVFGLFAGGLAAYGLAVAMSTRGVIGGRREVLEFMAAAAVALAFAFCAGVAILCEGNAAAPRRPSGAPERGVFFRLFLANGAGSLAAYFLAVSACVVGAALLGVATAAPAAPARPVDLWRPFCALLSPFMALAYGMVAYFHIARRLKKETPSPSFLFNTILVANIVLVIASVFSMIIAGEAYPGGALQPYVYGSNPIGLIAAAFDWTGEARAAALCGLAVYALLFLLLAPVAIGNLRKGRRDAA